MINIQNTVLSEIILNFSNSACI